MQLIRVVRMAKYLKEKIYPNLWTNNENIRYPVLYHTKLFNVFFRFKAVYESLINQQFYEQMIQDYPQGCEYAIQLMIDRPD